MKIIKVIITNIIILFLILLSCEFFLYKIDNDGAPFIQIVSDFADPKFSIQFDNIKKEGFYEYEPSGVSYNKFRKPVIVKNTNKKPIILFGCSFAWGWKLKDTQTFSYKLANLTQRSVYNRSLICGSPAHMLFQLKQEDFYKENPEPEYIVYLYISNHILRIYKYLFLFKWGLRSHYNELKYNDTKDGLVEESRLQNIPYCRLYNELLLPYYVLCTLPIKDFEFLEKHFVEAKKEADKHWKNTKFVIFDYDIDDTWVNIRPNVLNNKNVEKLKNDGFIVIKLSELTDKKLDDSYLISEEDKHPNEAAWNLITPLFAKKLEEYK